MNLLDNSVQYPEPQNNNQSWTYKFVRYFLHNRQLTLMLLLVVVLLGTASFLRLRVEGFPAIQIPVVLVTTVVPGAGPDTIDESVTLPIVNAVNGIQDLNQVSSTSQNSVSLVVLNFEGSADMNRAAEETRNKIQSLVLPEGAVEPEVFIPETGGAPFFVAVSGGVNLDELQKQSKLIEQKLLEIDGVKSFKLISGIKDKTYIELPPQFLNQQVIGQINSGTTAFPLGESMINGKAVPVSGQAQLQSVEDIKNLPITAPNASAAKLGDIAKIYDAVDSGGQVHRVGYLDEAENKFKIQPALLYEVRLENEADLLKLGKEVNKVVEETKSENSAVDYAIVFDQAAGSQAQVDEIVEGAFGGKWNMDGPLANIGWMFGGVWLLIISMLLFLDWRSALVSALAIPLSFFITFIVLQITGVEMNTLVLFSFILVLGLIVDPAIVVLESIKRYMEIGYKGETAALRASEVVGLGLFIAVASSVVVFIPFAVVSGTFGALIKYIPWTVFPALIASYFVPLIFLTWLGAKFLKANDLDHLANEDDPHTLWPIARWFIRTNRKILSSKVLSILVVVLGLVVPISVVGLLFSSGKVKQVQFSQPDDVEYLTITIPRPAGQSEAQLASQAAEVEEVLKQQVKHIKHFFYQSIDGNVGSGRGAQSLSVFVELIDPKKREVKSGIIAEEIQDQLRAKFGDQAIAAELGAGPPSENYPVSVKVFENDPQKIDSALAKIADELRGYKEVDSVVTGNDFSGSQLEVKVKGQQAAASGLTSAAVYGQVAGFLSERNLFTLNGREVTLRVSPESKPKSVDDLLNLTIFGSGGPVQVSAVASVADQKSASKIARLDGDRFAEVKARVKEEKDAITVQRKITDWAKANTGNLGVASNAFDDRVGVNEFEKSFQELFLAIGLSIIATYILFVLFFKSFVQPFIILFAIPLIMIGVFPALAFFNNGQFGFLETIGILMVIGIAENVAIFLIDYANRKVREGMDKREAVAIASGIRFRPILLTKLTTLAGLIPLAVFSPFWRGLALVVIFGVLASGILSLFTTPVLYSWFTRQKKDKTAVNTQLPL